jgi:hypothetical protein
MGYILTLILLFCFVWSVHKGTTPIPIERRQVAIRERIPGNRHGRD